MLSSDPFNGTGKSEKKRHTRALAHSESVCDCRSRGPDGSASRHVANHYGVLFHYIYSKRYFSGCTLVSGTHARSTARPTARPRDQTSGLERRDLRGGLSSIFLIFTPSSLLAVAAVPKRHRSPRLHRFSDESAVDVNFKVLCLRWRASGLTGGRTNNLVDRPSWQRLIMASSVARFHARRLPLILIEAKPRNLIVRAGFCFVDLVLPSTAPRGSTCTRRPVRGGKAFRRKFLSRSAKRAALSARSSRLAVSLLCLDRVTNKQK